MAKAKAKRWPKHPLVLIEWEDHFSEDRWECLEEAAADPASGTVRTVGWLIGETEDRYAVIQNMGIDGQVSMRMTILKGTVKGFKVLRKHG